MNISSSIRKLTNLFILLFIALSGGLVYWQAVAAEPVISNEHNNRHCLLENAPLRGRIFDRNGVLLADSKADPRARCGYMRHYYENSLAGVIGYYAGPNYPATGLERQYDDVLSGRRGTTSLDNAVNQTLHKPPVGDDVYLTIDVRIQRLVDQHFDDPVHIDNRLAYATDRGSVIVTNPHTGEVLALLSRPGYDPNKMVQTLQAGDTTYHDQLAADKGQPLLMRPLQGRYPPGSTYKTMTLIAGLDSGKTTLNQEFDEKQARGPVYYNGHPIGPVGNNIDGYTFHFPVTTEYGFTHSDNVIFAQIGVNTGYNAWLDYNKRFYVGQQIPFDLPVQPSSVLPPDGHQMNDVELASDSFGQGYDFVTPFQMSLVDNAVANDGQLMRPLLVSKVADHNNNALQTFGPQILGTPFSSQTATQVRQAMYDVTRCGSGSIVQALLTSTMGIIGKTGTAEVSGTGDIPPHGWLITQAPYTLNSPTQLPPLTIVGMKEKGGEGGFAVGPMTAHMYNDIFSQGYVQAQLPPPPDRNYCSQTGMIQ